MPDDNYMDYNGYWELIKKVREKDENGNKINENDNSTPWYKASSKLIDNIDNETYNKIFKTLYKYYLQSKEEKSNTIHEIKTDNENQWKQEFLSLPHHGHNLRDIINIDKDISEEDTLIELTMDNVNDLINEKLKNFKKEFKKELQIENSNLFNHSLIKENQSFYDFDNIEKYVVTSKLKEILEEEKISQTELCKKTQISRSTLFYIFNNSDTVSLKNAYKISKALNKPIEEIFDFEEEMHIVEHED